MSPDPDPLEDVALVRVYVDPGRLRAEREQAFHALVTRYQRRVFAICVRELGSRADAEDAAQDTFLHLARKAQQFRGDSAFSTFVYRVAINACRDLQRKQARRPHTPVSDVTQAQINAGMTPDVAEDTIAARETALVVEDALAQLDDLSRTLLILCAVEGVTYPEAAAILDMPVGTIKSRVFRARAQLAELLTEPADAPPTPHAKDAAIEPHPTAPRRARPRAPPDG